MRDVQISAAIGCTVKKEGYLKKLIGRYYYIDLIYGEIFICTGKTGPAEVQWIRHNMDYTSPHTRSSTFL